MDSKRYVQHISGQGAKWEVIGEDTYEWHLRPTYPGGDGDYHEVPKSEYIQCDSPPQWVDVTGECKISSYGGIQHHGRSTTSAPYRRIINREPFPHLVIERLEAI